MSAFPSQRVARHRAAVEPGVAARFRYRILAAGAGLIVVAVAWSGTTAGGLAAESDPATIPVGVARRDITPDYPIRLSGYAVRGAEAVRSAQRIWAKALAIGGDGEAAVLVTVDNCGVTADIVDEVARRLREARGIPRERFAVCSSHTHSAPCTTGFAPNIFAKAVPEEEFGRIVRYTAELADAIEAVALAALDGRRPATLAWGEGVLAFAANRRTVGGPVDHRLPILRAAAGDGRVIAVLASYACHCTTLGGDFNEICGDWAGFAQEALEREIPEAQAMVAIGCGADANPHPRHGGSALELAREHGEALGREALRVLSGPLEPLASPPECRFRRVALPYQTHFTRAELEERARAEGIVGYHARRWLGRLDRGEEPPPALDYPIQTWVFGSELAMVNLAGEVVVDYAHRLYRELGADRLWINAYSNDVPCYIPSRRILAEGGYEAESSLWYYDRPQKLAPEGEDILIDAVKALLPDAFTASEGGGNGAADPVERVPPPRDPESALRTIHVGPGFAVELVAAEPLAVDPVAIDWAADGSLLVAEMLDYPMGIDGRWMPGGRIRRLRDADGDGVYDAAEVFLDGLPFPTGVMAWGRGAFVCAAPDILFAEDTDGDGRADRVETWFTGFVTNNYQARVNGLQLGLDGWIYGANGLLGGTILAPDGGMEPFELGGRDFRFHPEFRRFEAVSGLSQHGRVRSDWGDWFGCDNGTLAVHFPLDARWLARNPAAVPPSDRIFVPDGEDANQLFPSSRTLARYNDPGDANRVTAACGIGVYRDVVLGGGLAGDLFVCEPVHNLVRRLDLVDSGISFKGLRAPEEERSEFLASTDHWCRPVQARTGPDGALWVVDMYRYLIEHPRWIPASRLEGVDVRAGTDRGRIYRVVPAAGAHPTPAPEDLTTLAPTDLAPRLRSLNGTERDRVHGELLRRGIDDAAAEALGRVAADVDAPPAARAHALHLLGGSGRFAVGGLAAALVSSEPRLRREAMRVAGAHFGELLTTMPDGPAAALDRLADDPHPEVRLQLALSLGEWDDPLAGEALARILIENLGDPWFRAAVVSSASPHAGTLVGALLGLPADSRGGEAWRGALGALVDTAGRSGSPDVVVATVDRLLEFADGPERNDVAGNLLAIVRGDPERFREAVPEASLAGIRSLAARVVGDVQAPTSMRADGVELFSLLGGGPASLGHPIEDLLAASAPDDLRRAVIDALVREGAEATPGRFLTLFPTQGPGQRREILRAWAARPEWHGALVSAVESGAVGVREVGPEVATLLRNAAGGPDSPARARLEAVLGAVVPPSGQSVDDAQAEARAAAIERLLGRAEAGRGLFEAACAACHRLRGSGADLGPELSLMKDRDAGFWIKNVAAPNLAVEPRYLGYLLRLTDGRVLAGVVRDESPAGFRLRQPGGTDVEIRRDDVVDLSPLGVSLMPEGLTASWSDQDFADLLAFVRSAPGAFGNPEPAVAEANRRAFLDIGCNGFLYAFAAAETHDYPSWLGPLRLSVCRLDGAAPGLVWQSDPVPHEIDAAAPFVFRLAAGMGFLSQPGGTFRIRIQGRDHPGVAIAATLEDADWASDDGRFSARYRIQQRNAEDGNGILELTVPGSWLVPGQPLTFEAKGEDRGSQQWFGIYQF